MKLKYYLRGLGIGILVTTLIFAIAGVTGNNSISDEEVIERAEKLGMVQMTDSSATITEALRNTETETETEQNSAAESQTEPLEQGTDPQSQTAVDQTQPVDAGQGTDVPAQPEEPSAQTTDSAVQPVAFTINQGEVPRVVAANLYAAGLIDNADSFIQYLRDQGLADQLQVGTYNITPGSDYAAVAAVLTTVEETGQAQ